MNWFSQLSLLGKIIICVVTTMVIGQIIGSYIYFNNCKESALDEMYYKGKAIARIAENARNAQAALLAAGAINSQELLSRAQERLKGLSVGSENFFKNLRETAYYKTIPVVSAFSAATPGASESYFTFKPTRFDPRNKEYAPVSATEKKLLTDLQQIGVDEISGVDKERNVFRYFKSVKLSKDCLVCHGTASDDPTRPNSTNDPVGFKKDGKKEGDKHGAFQIIIDLAQLDSLLSSVLMQVSLVSLLVLILSSFIVFFVLRRSVVSPIIQLTRDMNAGAEEVNSASQEVSSASQSLAEGASTQASSLEETSSSLEEISSMSKQNSDSARNAAQLSKDCQNGAEEAGSAMNKTIDAMNAIDEGTKKMQAIIKTIDEIAFQTNLLALNAAVEAARAGEAGKGFAVVAEEVRNLAQRSATAAKDTASLIEENVERAQEGSKISQNAGEILRAVVEKVEEVAKLLDGINQATNEQTDGITQVNSAVASMDQITQQNAATAEESAAASEELRAQAESLKGMVRNMVLQITGGAGEVNFTPKAVKTEAPKRLTASVRNTAAAPRLVKRTDSQKNVTGPEKFTRKKNEDAIPMDDDFEDYDKEFAFQPI